MIELGGFQVVSLMAVGMGGAVWLTDRDSPTSRALGLFLAGMGISILASAYVPSDGPLPEWTRLLGAFDALAFIAGTEWGLRVGQTIASTRVIGPGRWLIRASQLLIIAYAAAVAAWPALRARDLMGQVGADWGTLPPLKFWLVSAPWLVSFVLVTVAGYRVLREKPDRAEAARIASMLVVMPLFASSLAVPVDISPIFIALGELVFLAGALRYHNVQGARAQFMSQFLAPQVAELVRKRGLKNAMSRQRQVVTVVCADIRGFTAYAQANPPEKVMRLLRDFYSSLGAAAAEYGGTIKDLAGDGALILIGAPVEFDDNARRALGLGRRLQAKTRAAVQKYSGKLGLGVGIATGEVAVGIVGQGARYEYVAVGPPVNLASRLCDEARDGEIRVDAQTLTQAGEELPKKSELRQLKGVGTEVPTYALAGD